MAALQLVPLRERERGCLFPPEHTESASGVPDLMAPSGGGLEDPLPVPLSVPAQIPVEVLFGHMRVSPVGHISQLFPNCPPPGCSCSLSWAQYGGPKKAKAWPSASGWPNPVESVTEGHLWQKLPKGNGRRAPPSSTWGCPLAQRAGAAGICCQLPLLVPSGALPGMVGMVSS